MKFTHRVAGPRKGNGSGTIKVRKPPKAKPKQTIARRFRHTGAFARISDVVRKTTVAVLLLAAPAQAQPTGLVLPSIVLGSFQAADVVTTHRARSSGHGVEANPWMRGGIGQQIVIKAGATLGAIYLCRQLEKREHPRLAKALLYVGAAAIGAVAIQNERIARR